MNLDTEAIKYTQNKKINVLSLFSGCGGMDLGFEGGFIVNKKCINTKIHNSWRVCEIDKNNILLPRTGFETVFANDIREDAKAAWIKYFCAKGSDKSAYHLSSIVDLVKQYKSGDKSVFPQNIDIVTGGFPCQDFSTAGKRQGFNSSKSHDGSIRANDIPTEESRGQLYMWMREVISIVKPKIFFAENVKGLTTLDDAKEIIQHDFSTVCDGGYLVVPARILLAANYGVPQSRERIIFIGFKRSSLLPEASLELSKISISTEYDPYPLITHSLNSSDVLMPYVTTNDIFEDLLEPNETADVEQQKYSTAKFMEKGQGNREINLNKISPTIRSEHHGNIEFRRLSLEHGGTHNFELESGLKERRLTIRECARIQTFPDEYKFIIEANNENKAVSASSAYKLIGNAVPPLLAFNIAMNLREKWERYFK